MRPRFKSESMVFLMALLAVLALGSLTTGCPGADETAILVEFTSTMVPVDEIDRIEFKVFASGSEVYKENIEVGGEPFGSFPQTLLLLPGESTRDSLLVLSARGLLEGLRVAFDEKEAEFVGGEVKKITLQLGPCKDFDEDDYGVGEACPVQDCNDEDPSINPGASEACDGKDNDCDGETDEDFDFETDPRHCGGCNRTCPEPPPNAEAVCIGGECGYVCTEGYARCGEDCVDTQNDVQNCGGCGITCTDAPPKGVPACLGGNCDFLCDDGYTRCHDACVDTRTDVRHCGSCDNPCPEPADSTALCNGGVCDFVCDADYTKCTDVCADVMTDARHCGSCDSPCPEPADSTALCDDGVCGFACDAGYTKCTDVCADVMTDARHCGSCDSPCPEPADSTALCDGGVCDFVCSAGYTKCTDVCADVMTNVRHCGSCDSPCPEPAHSTALCDGGVCGFVCDAGYTRCTDACADVMTDARHCGSCDSPCPEPAHSTAVCSGGSCGFVCNAGYTGCGALCVDTQSDNQNCGGCGRVCAPPHATGQCSSGECTIVACDDNYNDANGNPWDGCEYLCTPTPDPTEVCDGADNDCDGTIDNTDGVVYRVPDQYATIQAAIDAACWNVRIEVSAGVYDEEIDLRGEYLHLVAVSGPELTRIAGIDDNGVPVVSVTSGEPPGTSIEGFAIGGTEASPAHDGIDLGATGIMVLDSNLVLTNNVIAWNENVTVVPFDKVAGGGWVSGTSSVEVHGGRFSNNVANAGDSSYIVGGLGITDGSEVQISGTTFEDNLASIGGNYEAAGAIRIYGSGSSLYLDDCNIIGNQATALNGHLAGGLLVMNHADVHAFMTTVSRNQSSAGANSYVGGGMNAMGHSRLDIVGCTFSSNSATLTASGYGGAGGVMAYSNATLEVLSDTIFVENTLTCNGNCKGSGGVYLYDSSTQKLVRNSFLRNTSSAGLGTSSYLAGGVYICFENNVVIAQNLFAENAVTSPASNISAAGGLMLNCVSPCIHARPFVVNNTLANNVLDLTGSTSNAGGGIYCYGSDLNSAEFHGLIVWGNDEDAVHGDVCVPSYSDIDGAYPSGGVGNISGDPRFQDPPGDDYTLQGISPCINQGNPDPAYDDTDGTRNDMGHTGGPDY